MLLIVETNPQLEKSPGEASPTHYLSYLDKLSIKLEQHFKVLFLTPDDPETIVLKSIIG
jgi:hypothetical protein